MASVVRRPPQTDGGVARWLVRYTNPAGLSRSKTFVKKVDADRFAATIEADKSRGSYVDPSLGRMTLEEYGKGWLEAQTFGASTREATELRLRIHVYPHLGSTALVMLRPTQISAWLRRLAEDLAPRYVRVIFANLSSVLSAAVDDERLTKNPCQAASVRLPRAADPRLVPWRTDAVQAVAAALPSRYRVLVAIGAGCGLRQGEIFGLAVEDVDFLRGVVHVRRQVKIVGGQQVYAPPKGRKVRDVPLPSSVASAMAAHLQEWPAAPVELPWEPKAGEVRCERLLLTTRERTALQRNYVNAQVWKPALVAAGCEPTRENGMHALRHFYASVLLDAGESIRRWPSTSGTRTRASPCASTRT